MVLHSVNLKERRNVKVELSNYPRELNTREDYEFVRNNFPRKYWEEDYKRLLDDSFEDIPVAKVSILTTKVEDDDGSGEEKEIHEITARKDFDVKTKKGKEKWISLVKHLKEIERKETDFDAEDDEEEGRKEILTDCFDVTNRDEYLNTNERLKLYITKEGFLRYYVYRTVEKPNSKIRQLGYTPDEVVDWIVGVDEREAELEEFKKETNEKAISMLADSLGIDKEEARELFNKEQEENINKDE